MREAHFLHYVGYLINEHHFVPYRDVLETSWFGTFVFHMWIGNLFGYTAGAFRTADTLWLLTLMVIWWRVLQRLNQQLAGIACLSLALLYLHLGPANTLQRDYLALLPVSMAFLLSLDTQLSVRRRALCTGLLFGLAVAIKPHQLIGLPVVLAVIRSLTPLHQRHWPSLLAWTALGGTSSFGLGLCWLAWKGGLVPFLDMTFHYLPLYQSFDGAHHVVSWETRLAQTQHWWRFFTWLWPVPIALGCWRGITLTAHGTPERALAWGLPALTLAYNLYPLPAGKFWDYHWIPYSCLAILASSLLLIPAPDTHRQQRWLTPVCVIVFFLFARTQYQPWNGLWEQIHRFPRIQMATPYDDDMAQFLREHTPPGGTVQPIDQGGPTSLWMLKAGSTLATPYIGSFMFLHDTGTPFVQHAQQDFLQRLTATPPALIIQMADFTKPHGPNTLNEIPGLQALLRTDFHPLRVTDTYTIWQHNRGDGTTAKSTPTPISAPTAAPATPP